MLVDVRCVLGFVVWEIVVVHVLVGSGLFGVVRVFLVGAAFYWVNWKLFKVARR